MGARRSGRHRRAEPSRVDKWVVVDARRKEPRVTIAPATKDQRFRLSPAGFSGIRAREQRRPDAPIVVGVDGSSRDQIAARTAVSMAWRLGAPVVFVYVRRGPAAVLGAPYFQRRLTAEIVAGRRALDDA